MFSRSLSFFVALACAALSTSAPIVALPLDPTVLAGIISNGVAGTVPNVGLPVSPPSLPLPPVPRQLGGLTNEGVATAEDLVSVAVENILGDILPDLPPVPRQLGRGERGGLVHADHILGGLLNDILPRDPQVDISQLKDTTELPGVIPGLPALPGFNPGLIPGLIPGLPIPRQIGEIDDVLQDVDVVLPRQVEHPCLPEVFHSLVVKITPISNKLKAAVSVKAEIDAEVVVGLLNDLIALLTEAVAQVQYIIDNPAGFTLSLAGTILSITQVAGILVEVLSIVLPVLATVVGVVEGTLATLVLPLVGTIGSLVASLLTLALTLVPGLLAVLLPLIQSLIATIYYLRLADVITILGLGLVPLA